MFCCLKGLLGEHLSPILQCIISNSNPFPKKALLVVLLLYWPIFFHLLGPFTFTFGPQGHIILVFSFIIAHAFATFKMRLIVRYGLGWTLWFQARFHVIYIKIWLIVAYDSAWALCQVPAVYIIKIFYTYTPLSIVNSLWFLYVLVRVDYWTLILLSILSHRRRKITFRLFARADF